jgi:hypothetical protein
MPRGKRKEGSETPRPLISFERVAYERATYKLSRAVLNRITEYAAYVRDASGEEPSPDEVVDKGMQRLFDADRGFRLWLQKTKGGNGAGVMTEKPAKPPGVEEKAKGGSPAHAPVKP